MYNDGWDGDAHISVMHSDREVASLWLEYGESGVLRSLNLCDGETYSFVWVCGSCDNECSFEFYGPDGNLIQGMNYSEGEVSLGEYGEEYPLMSNYVMQCPTCKKPRNLSVVTTPSSASITWTADSGHNSWELQYSTDETNWSATQNITGNPIGTINSLDPATEYFARVRANCGDGDFSTWSTIAFYTDCGTIMVDASHPYFENFDAIRGWGFYDNPGGHILPRCWDALNYSENDYDMYYPTLFGEHPYYDNIEGGEIGYKGPYDECETSYSCPTYLRFHASDASEQYAILPAMYNINALQLKFMASMADAIGFEASEFHVGVMTDPTDASTYTEIKSYVFLVPGYEELTVYFNEYELQPDVDEYYIALKLEVPNDRYGEFYVDDVSVSVLPSCLAPYELTVSNVQENDVTLTWSPNGNETAWQVRYSTDKTNWTTVDFTEAEPGETVTKLLDNLSHNTLYYVQVRANCGDSYSDWSRASRFRTDCSSTYQDVPYFEDFDSYIDFEERLPQCWTYINNSHSEQYPGNEAYPLIANGVEGYFANSYLYFLIRYYDYLNYHYGMDPQDQYVIMPRMEDIGNLQLKFLGKGERNDYWTDYNCQVKIGVFDDNGTFHLIRTVETSRDGYFKNYYVSFEGYEGAGRITFLVETPQQFGSRCYESLVKIDNVSVTPKVSYKKFIADGNWNDASCWENGEMPTSASDNVLIRAAAVIPSGCSAVCGTIEFDGNGASITIEDGGALKHNNSGVNATVKKHIEPYTEGERDQWNLMAVPCVEEIYCYYINNLISGDYDLYYFDQSYDGAEWRNRENYMTSWYYLAPLKGYLYANAEEVTLEFNGELFPSNADQSVSLDYVEGVGKTGWNLIGNPFVCPAYLANNMAYYRMNATGTALESALAGTAIQPTEGVFVRATDSGQTAVFTTNPQGSKSRLDIRLSRNQGRASDNAIIGFGEGSTLVKVMLNSNASKIYFTEDRVDYSIIRGGQVGEEVLNFKAAEDGAYTLSFSFEDVDMTYLHLIDNKTGIETDLLQTPSYSFDANTGDYESRFKLVFVTDGEGAGLDNDEFAFFSNGNWIILNEGEAVLQVIDVNGRVLRNETIQGTANVNVNAAPGIYMMRLVNGDNVKVQKVVVR